VTEFDRISLPLEQALASALRRLAELAHMSSWDQWNAQSLTSTQRKVLEIIAGNRGEILVSTIAGDLDLTPATADDAISALETRNLVVRRSSHVDGQALAVKLSSEGRRCVTALSKLPDPLRAAFDCLEKDEQERFYRASMKMIRTLQEDGLMPVSRMCVRCQYFDPYRYPDSATPHHCHLVCAPFGDRHLRLDCPEHALASPDVQEALWVRFTSQPDPKRKRDS
jgi:DNA-binding MarR family transcriptional regulator